MDNNTISPSDLPDQGPLSNITNNPDYNHVSNKAVYAALIANLGIFLVKLTFGILSKSSAMLSESAHSLADSFNSFALIIGLKRSNKPADSNHPFGYGLEANIWTLFACILMLLGSFISIYLGIDRIADPRNHNVNDLFQHYNLIMISLFLAFMFEAWAVNSATIAVLSECNIKPKNFINNIFVALKHINCIKSPTTRFVWFEDTAALSGVVITLISITISRYLVPMEFAYIPDGIASLIIGLILLLLAIFLLINYLNLLGAAAKPQIEEIIKETTLSINGISEVCELKTMDMGISGLIVNMEVEVNPETPVKDVDDLTQRIEEKLKIKLPDITHVNIAVQADESEENWQHKFEELIQEGIKEGIINRKEAKILQNIYYFTETTVDEVMVNRTEIDCLEKNDSIKDLIDIVVKTGHTRIPVYDESIDNIIGVIHSKDVFKILQNGKPKEEINLKTLTREIPIVPENKPVSKMLNEFITNKVQIALIADEHGGISGLVTIEDLLEEIFGEIWDEYDVEVVEYKRIDPNTILVASKVNIEELNDRYNFNFPTEEFQTIGGFVFGQIGRIPKLKDTVEFEDITLTIDSMNGRKIGFIKMYKPEYIIDKYEEEEKSIENT